MKKYILRKKISFFALIIMSVLTCVFPIILRFSTKLDSLDATIFNLERLGLSSSTLQNLYLTVLSIGITCYFTALSMALNKKTSIYDYFKFCGWEKIVLEILILVAQLVWIFCPKNKFISCRDCYIAFSIFCLFIIFAINLISMATIQKGKWMRYKICNSLVKEAKKFKKQCEEKSDNDNLHVYSKKLKSDIISFALKCFEKETPYTLINDCLDELEVYEKEDKNLCVDYCYAYIFFIRGCLIFKEKDHKPDDDEFKLFERCLLRSVVGRLGNYDFDYVLGTYLDVYENLVKKYCLLKSHILAIKEALLFYNMKHKTEEKTDFRLIIETCKRIIVFSAFYVEKREFERMLKHFCFLKQLNMLNGNSEQNRKVFDKSIVDLAIWIYNLSVTKEIDGNEYAVYIPELLKHASEIVMNDFDTDFYHEILPETDVNVQKYTRNFYISAILLYIGCSMGDNDEASYSENKYFETFFNRVKYCDSQNINKRYDIILQSLNGMTEMDFLKTSTTEKYRIHDIRKKFIHYIQLKKDVSKNCACDLFSYYDCSNFLKSTIVESFKNLKQQEQEKHDVSELYSFLLKKYVPCKCEDSVDYYDVCLPYLVDKLPYLPNKELISIKSISDLIERDELINGSTLFVPKQYKNYLDTHEIEGVSDYERGVSGYKRGVLSNGKKKLFVEYIDCKSNYIVSKEKFESVVCYNISDDEEKSPDCVALEISFGADNRISLPLYKIEG